MSFWVINRSIFFLFLLGNVSKTWLIMLKNAFHRSQKMWWVHLSDDHFYFYFYLFFGVQMVKMTIRRSTSKKKNALVFLSFSCFKSPCLSNMFLFSFSHQIIWIWKMLKFTEELMQESEENEVAYYDWAKQSDNTHFMCCYQSHIV